MIDNEQGDDGYEADERNEVLRYAVLRAFWR